MAEAVDALIARIYRDPQDFPATELGKPTHGLVPGGHINNCLLRAELLADLLAQACAQLRPYPAERCRGIPTACEARVLTAYPDLERPESF
jgi:hypothetical protein